MLKPNEIPIDYRESFEKEISLLDSILQKLKSEMEIIQSNSLSIDDELGYGSRVTITYKNGEKINGRVTHIDKYKENFYIHRDGHNSLIKMKANDLIHLSIGVIGRLEKQIWILQQRKSNLENILYNSEIDIELIENKTSLIEIVSIIEEYPCEILEYVLAKNLKSGSLKVPQNLIKEVGFYELNISDSNVLSFKKSSKLAFEKSIEK